MIAQARIGGLRLGAPPATPDSDLAYVDSWQHSESDLSLESRMVPTGGTPTLMRKATIGGADLELTSSAAFDILVDWREASAGFCAPDVDLCSRDAISITSQNTRAKYTLSQ